MHRYERYAHDPLLGRLGTSLRVQLGLWRRRPRRDGGPERKFFVFAQGRTGSTLLATLLDAHPDVQCDHEILSVPVLAPLRYVERTSLVCPARAHGFRVKIYQLTSVQRMARPREFVHALHDRGYRILHLQRENLLRQAISNLYAAANRTYHYVHDSGRGRERVPLRPLDPLRRAATMLRRRWASRRPAARGEALVADCAELVRMMEKRLRYADDEARVLAGLPVHRLSYERDLLPPEAHQPALDRAFAFLELPSVPVASNLVRSVDGKLEDTVRNLSEVEQALRHTPFERFLDDPRYA